MAGYKTTSLKSARLGRAVALPHRARELEPCWRGGWARPALRICAFRFGRWRGNGYKSAHPAASPSSRLLVVYCSCPTLLPSRNQSIRHQESFIDFSTDAFKFFCVLLEAHRELVETRVSSSLSLWSSGCPVEALPTLPRARHPHHPSGRTQLSSSSSCPKTKVAAQRSIVSSCTATKSQQTDGTLISADLSRDKKGAIRYPFAQSIGRHRCS